MPAATETMTTPLRIALALAGILAAVFLIAPRTSPGLVAALAAITMVSAGPLRMQLLRPPPPLALWAILGLAFGAWLLISVAWSVDRTEGIGKVAIFAGLLAALWLASRSAPTLDRDTHAELLRALVIAVAVAAAYLCIEEFTAHAIKRTLFSLLPWTRPSARHIGISGSEVAFVEAYISNRNMAALSLALWPALLAASLVFARSRMWIICAALLVLAVLTVSRSQHESSAVAIVAGALVVAIGFASLRLATGLVAAGWITACLLVVPIADLAYREAGLHMASWLPHTARQRVILWGYTAAQVHNRPLHGVGIASTKPLDDARREGLSKLPGHVYELRTGPHSHNIFLQTWYELGAVGALLLMLLGLAVIRTIAFLDRAVQPMLLAAFTSAALIGAFTWGMWQAWFMGAFAFSALLALLAASYAARRN